MYLNTGKDIEDFLGENPLIACSLRVTKACNAKCRHCYSNGGKKLDGELSYSEIIDTLDQLSDMGVNKVFFTGGEPFLRKDMVEILEYAHQKDIKILVSSNASLITAELMERLKHIPFNMFQLSLDGDQETHDANRGLHFYSKVLNSVGLAKEYNISNITIGTCLTNENSHTISHVTDFILTHEVPIFALMLLLTTGRATEALSVQMHDLLRVISDFFEKYKDHLDDFIMAENCVLPPALVPKELRDKNVHKMFDVCCAFPNIMGIDADGNVAPCDGFLEFPECIAGNIREQDVHSIWNKSEIFQKLKTEFDVTKLEGICGNCVFRDTCAGGCRAEAYIHSKSFTAPFPICQAIYDAGLFPVDCLVRKKEVSLV